MIITLHLPDKYELDGLNFALVNTLYPGGSNEMNKY